MPSDVILNFRITSDVLVVELLLSGEWSVTEEGGGIGQNQPNLEGLLNGGFRRLSGKMGISPDFMSA